MRNFSSKHKLHLLDPPLYEIACFNIDQSILKPCLFSSNSQIYFESSVFAYFLKENKQDFRIDWSILKHTTSYRGGSNRCNLCLEEKFLILSVRKTRINYKTKSQK